MIIDEVEKIIKPVYLVGGSVRDQLLNKVPKDYDFATPLSPEEVENAIREAGRKPYLAGKRFGTIGFKIKYEGKYEIVEVTTFRNEKYVKGSRKPDVTFVKDITADLSRRDFTINAIAIRGNKDTFIDPFDGITDIKNKIIRCVGKPAHRFKEDPLRMLRACRFASTLGFNVDDETLDSMKQLNYKILEVSKERWMQELDKLLVSNNPTRGLILLMNTGMLKFMMPELSLQFEYNQNNPHHKFDLWAHTLRVVKACPNDINFRWSALLHDTGKPFVRKDKIDKSNYIKHELVSAEIVKKYATYLKWSNSRTETVLNIVKNHMSIDSPLKQYEELSK